MSYRIGIYVMDRRRSKIGQVMGHDGPYMQLRPPGGGIEWDCRSEDARLVTGRERRKSGERPQNADLEEKK